MYKKLFIAILLFFITQQVYAKEIEIKITPQKEYSTAHQTPKTGDYLNFVVTEDSSKIKAGTIVTGLLTDRIENGFGGKPAELYIEQFKIDDIKLEGIVYKKGNMHKIYFDYFDNIFALPLKIFDSSCSYVRGGEVFLKPNVDIFTLYLKEK